MKFTVFKDAKGEWRWNLKAPNGKIIADSAEGYKRRRSALRGILLVINTGWNSDIVGQS